MRDNVCKKCQFYDMNYKMLTENVNSPHNPTGKVFTKGELEIIAGECCSRNCLAITDEVCTSLHCFVRELLGIYNMRE